MICKPILHTCLGAGIIVFQVSAYQRVINIDVCNYFGGYVSEIEKNTPTQKWLSLQHLHWNVLREQDPGRCLVLAVFTLQFYPGFYIKKHKLTFKKKCCMWFALPELL